MRGIRVRDLPELVTRDGWKGPRPFLYCETCGNESSASKGDYFAAHPDTVFKCCRRNMVLVTREVRHVPFTVQS